jgi:glycosyltransferase involved in cell wall biosynthesis
MLSPRSRHWYFAYGIEVWSPLPASVRKGLALAEKVLSISAYSARELTANGGVPADRIEILPCALDEIWQRQYSLRDGEPVATAGPPALLTVARLAKSEKYKGIDSVIRALPDVARQHPDVAYDVVGDGDDRARLEAIAREAGVSDRVRFRGRLWPDELAAAYRDCTFFVMPSSKEGFGIVFLEAALFGKPSVAGNHGGTPEVVEDGVTGMLVDREDIPGVSRAIRLLLSDNRLRARMGSAAKERLHARFTYPVFRRALGAAICGAPGPGEPNG